MATSRETVLRDDACPGVLRLTEAADGALARVRLAGGFLSAEGFSALADAAQDLGDGRVALTSRGNVQIRGLGSDAGAGLGAPLRAAGLWPSESHERVRNIVASPLAGLDRRGDLTEFVRALDTAVCASARLAELSGRFLFAVDDGRGDVAHLGADVLVQDDRVNGLRVADRVAAAVTFAAAFLDEREAQASHAWRIADLVDGANRVRRRVASGQPQAPNALAPRSTRRCRPPLAGPFTRIDGGRAIVLAVPLGNLDVEQLRWFATVTTGRPARVTPWRSVVLANASESLIDAATRLGFGVTPDTPWSSVSACAGKPGCANALADVQIDAAAAIERWPGRVVHWSGCERHCGRPAHADIDVTATADGYRIEPSRA